MTEQKPGPAPDLAAEIDTSVPHSARIWNYWLGGTDNYPVDRAAGDEYRQVYPQIIDVARASRAFQARAVRFLAAEARLRQFLDVGAGLPTADNTHQIAQRIAPGSRIVYVDNDPPVVAHARQLLSSTPEGAAGYLAGDLYQPEQILSAAAGLLDLTRPVALLLMGVLGHIEDGDAYPIARRLLDGLPTGSYLVLQDGVNTTETFHEAQQGYDDTGAIPYRLRRPEQVAAFFAGLDLAEPGVTRVALWRPDLGETGPDADVVGGVARKPPGA
jgi:trans-aconitate methyltransferase